MNFLKLFIFAFMLLPLALPAQDLTGIAVDYLTTKAVEQVEKQLFSTDTTDTAPEEDEGWDDYFRTSDLETESATGFRRDSEAPAGVRTGCICMDGSRRDERGRGACSGRGGVRFWIYQVGEDSTVHFPTDRHWDHPEPLSERELNNLSAYNTSPGDDDEEKDEAPDSFWMGQGLNFGLWDVLAAMMICLTMAYTSKLWFGND